MKYLPIKEFVEAGYLQVVNRLFLHPLGLALEVAVDEGSGAMVLTRIWDVRDDPEGIVFDDGLDPVKAGKVATERQRRAGARLSGLGFVVQPVGEA